MAAPVFLFDLDGVLVQPGGYRRTFSATVHAFTRRMGLGDVAPGEAVLALFEAHAMTNEWDMACAVLAHLFDRLLEGIPGLELPADLDAACRAVAAAGLRPPETDYECLVRDLAGLLRPGITPSGAALEACRGGDGACPFPHLAGRALLETLLARPHPATGNPVVRVFQAYALGSELFREAYGAPPPFATRSYLRDYDTNLLAPALRDALLARWREGALALAAMTARLSRPPRGVVADARAFPPEAEIALDVAGLAGIPLIGSGSIGYLAQQRGVAPQTYLKPAPVQALAATFAARTGDEWDALQRAEALVRLDGAAGGVDLGGEGERVQIHVFEDAPGGVRACRAAQDILTKCGMDVELRAWGVATDANKVAALRAVGADVHAGVDAALEAALDRAGLCA